MKKIALLLLVLLLGNSLAFADEFEDPMVSGRSSDLKSGSYIGFGLGGDVLGTNWTNYSTLGSGGEFIAGYQLDPSWAIQADVEHWVNTGSVTVSGSATNFSQDSFRGVLCAKYTINSKMAQVYLLAGGGIVGSSLNILGTVSTATNLDALGGLGLQFDLNPSSHLFVEGKYNFILSAGSSSQDFPITAGILTNL